MWFALSILDMRCIFVFVVVTAISFLFSYLFIMDHPSDAKAERIQASILIYGSAQSFIGFMGGFYISKLLYGPYVREGGHFARETYGFVKSDDDIMEV